MLFVTVGTHEQPFNRLVKYMDNLKKNRVIEEEIIIQTGYSTYKPKYCKWQNLYPYKSMIEFVNSARIVITHGGPSSFIMPLQAGKIPVVVPRQKKYGEHVNDHQVAFIQEVAKRMGTVIAVLNIEELGGILKNYDEITSRMKAGSNSNNIKFNEELGKIVDTMFEKKNK